MIIQWLFYFEGIGGYLKSLYLNDLILIILFVKVFLHPLWIFFHPIDFFCLSFLYYFEIIQKKIEVCLYLDRDSDFGCWRWDDWLWL